MADKNHMLDHALSYARRGLAIFPCHAPTKTGRCSCGRDDCSSIGKHPRVPQGVKQATTEENKIRQWWEQWPSANIAVACGQPSNICALDIDGPTGEQSLQSLVEEYGPLYETATVQTGRGKHFYFRLPNGAPIKNSAGLVAPGIYVRGDGGYTILPPSRHASGSAYKWASNIEPVDSPEWLQHLLIQPKHEANTNIANDKTDPIPQGQRNPALTSIAGGLRKAGMEEAEIEKALKEINQRRCQPPLSEREVANISRSVGRYEKGEPQKDKKKVKPVTISLAELDNQDLEPVRWVVPGLLPVGLALLAGKPKSGKSWAALSLVLSVGTGGNTFGQYPSEPGEVLGLFLEDSLHRIKERQRKQLGADIPSPQHVHVSTQWPPGEPGLDAISGWLIEHPDFRDVLVDTLAKVRQSKSRGRDSYL